jgi:hypothetical protein
MNNRFLLLCAFLLLVFFSPFAYGQKKLTKKEKDALIKELKKLYQRDNIHLYKEMKDGLITQAKEYHEVERTVKKQVTELTTIGNEYVQEQKESKALRDEIERIKKELAKGTFKPESYSAKIDYACESPGTVYKIQFEMEEGDLATDNKKILFTGDLDSDGKRKYTIACFENLEQAQEFSDKLQGIKIPSKIVKYQDGKKVE